MPEMPVLYYVRGGAVFVGDSRKRGGSMNAAEYIRKQTELQNELLREIWEGLTSDPDIWNLEYMICSIQPGSLAWRSGHIRSLRRAIRALERENRERGKEQK